MNVLQKSEIQAILKGSKEDWAFCITRDSTTFTNMRSVKLNQEIQLAKLK